MYNKKNYFLKLSLSVFFLLVFFFVSPRFFRDSEDIKHFNSSDECKNCLTLETQAENAQQKELSKVESLNKKIETQEFLFEQCSTEKSLAKLDKIAQELETIEREAQKHNIINIINYPELVNLREKIVLYVQSVSEKRG